MRITPIIFLFSAVLTACTASDDAPLSKAEVRGMAQAGKADGIDWCAELGWYDDGICDEFCVQPDPDCAAADGCFVGGCSSQLCGDEPGQFSTCEFRPEYACFDTATCERQASGECGWTQTAELTECIEDAVGGDDPPTCDGGTVVSGAGGFVPSADGMECQVPTTHCLTNDVSACPQIHPLPPTFCPDGTVVQGPARFTSSADGLECELPSVHCVTNDANACPFLSPVSPDFCPDGTIVNGPPSFIASADGMECQMPSIHCVTDDTSTCPQF